MEEFDIISNSSSNNLDEIKTSIYEKIFINVELSEDYTVFHQNEKITATYTIKNTNSFPVTLQKIHFLYKPSKIKLYHNSNTVVNRVLILDRTINPNDFINVDIKIEFASPGVTALDSTLTFTYLHPNKGLISIPLNVPITKGERFEIISLPKILTQVSGGEKRGNRYIIWYDEDECEIEIDLSIAFDVKNFNKKEFKLLRIDGLTCGSAKIVDIIANKPLINGSLEINRMPKKSRENFKLSLYKEFKGLSYDPITITPEVHFLYKNRHFCATSKSIKLVFMHHKYLPFQTDYGTIAIQTIRGSNMFSEQNYVVFRLEKDSLFFNKLLKSKLNKKVKKRGGVK